MQIIYIFHKMDSLRKINLAYNQVKVIKMRVVIFSFGGRDFSTSMFI